MEDPTMDPAVAATIQTIRFEMLAGIEASTQASPPARRTHEERFNELPQGLRHRYLGLQEEGILRTPSDREYALDWLETTRQLVVYLREMHCMRVGEPAAEATARAATERFLALPWSDRVDIIPTLSTYSQGSYIVCTACDLAVLVLTNISEF